MRCAAIDIGTNTFHLIIADLSGSSTNIVYKDHQPVKLGEGSINQGFINDAAMARAVAAFLNFRKKLDEYEVKNVHAVATSAVRSAINGDDLVRVAKERCGINIDIIDGDREAELIYRAVQASGSLDSISLIMDIGGGSTEFILADHKEIIWKKSYDLGASRLWQKYFKSDPINNADQHAFTAYIEEMLSPLFKVCEVSKPKMLVGTAGAFESYVSMLNPNADLHKRFQNIEIDGFSNLFETLRLSTHEERCKMKGLVPLRVDMIVAAAFLTRIVLDNTAIPEIRMTSFDLKMGILESLKVD